MAAQVISIDALHRRSQARVDWTKLMINATPGRSSLSFLTLGDAPKVLVMTRNYGAINAVMLSDSAPGKPAPASAVLRLSQAESARYMTHYSEGVVAAQLLPFYSQIDAHCTKMGQPLPGPLAAARAAYAMKAQDATVEDALTLAYQQAEQLIFQQQERASAIEAMAATATY